jgi:glutamine amidotransferase
MTDTLIIDSGGANLASLQYAFARLGVATEVSAAPKAIAAARRVLLPGVGSAAAAMERLRAAGLAELLPRLSQPVLGICLGMQLLFEHSAEGDVECLGILPQRVRRLQPSPSRPVPHMGWNRLEETRTDPLLEGLASGPYFYFVHGYVAPVGPFTLGAVEYGESFSAVVRRGNFWGVQFHPERSAAAGARVLANFLSL